MKRCRSCMAQIQLSTKKKTFPEMKVHLRVVFLRMFSSLNTVVSLLQGPRLELDEVRNFNDKIKKEKRVSTVASSIPACSLRVTLKTESCSRSRATSHVVQLYMDPGNSLLGETKKEEKKKRDGVYTCSVVSVHSHRLTWWKVWSVIIHVFIRENNEAVCHSRFTFAAS